MMNTFRVLRSTRRGLTPRAERKVFWSGSFLALIAVVVSVVSSASAALSHTIVADSNATQAIAARPQVRELSPRLFSELASGIALVRTFNCGGNATGEGTGFLVGTSVVMTARHVVRGACRVKVLLQGKWIPVHRTTSWHTSGRRDLDAADVATIKLKSEAAGHVFKIRTSSVAPGTNLAALGHPLGNNISLNQGRVVEKVRYQGVPLLAVRLLAAEGGSGSPLVDAQGNVVGILQLGLGSKDLYGQRTSGAILGINLPAWWPTMRKNLCKAYPHGGIPGCGGASAAKSHPMPPQPLPPFSAPPPPPAASWLPSGFSLWTGAGDYKAGTIGTQTSPCSRTVATSARCWGVNVVSQTGCLDDAILDVEIFDQAGVLVDTGIDTISGLVPGKVKNAHGDTFVKTAASFSVTQIDCFDS